MNKLQHLAGSAAAEVVPELYSVNDKVQFGLMNSNEL